MKFTVDLPVTFQVEEASKEKPYFGFRLGLDPALVASVVMESDIQIMKGDAITKAMNVSSIDADLFDAVVRLVRLARRMSKAIGHLREHFDEQLKMEDIARELGMSVSGFHHNFKSVTSMSPLQFQNHLRLQEARRLMLGEDMDAASAAFRVGYQDPSHFGREYKKQFGAPPHRDVARLRTSLSA